MSSNYEVLIFEGYRQIYDIIKDHPAFKNGSTMQISEDLSIYVSKSFARLYMSMELNGTEMRVSKHVDFNGNAKYLVTVEINVNDINSFVASEFIKEARRQVEEWNDRRTRVQPQAEV